MKIAFCKMQSLYTCALFFLGYLYLTNACPVNTICTRKRDTIIQLNTTLEPLETGNESRVWYIRPGDEPFTAMLAFKNFSVETSVVYLYVYDGQGQLSTRYLYGNLGDFEIILEDSAAIIVHVPVSARKKTQFVLNYYTGCAILTSTQDEINHISITNHAEHKSQCWLIHPSDSDDRKRVYFSIRDVYLPRGQILKIWDLHTSNLIMRTNSEEYSLIAAESQEIHYHQSIVVDYECFSETCTDDYHAFFLTYYTMTQADSACISTHQSCTELELSNGHCSFECPALNNMIREEFNYQIYQPSTPVIRAGAGYEIEAGSHADIEQKCILPPKYCNCPESVKKESFCARHVKCFRRGACAYACIYHKVTSCLRITILRSIKLL